MENENALLWEVSFWEFLFVTVILAGGAAYMTGRAVAQSWLTVGVLAVYIVLLTVATRFIHFALFSGSLLTVQYFIVDLIVLLAIAFTGMRVTRRRQMAHQYRFRSGQIGTTVG
jgi:hypothetical protein